MHLFLPKSPLLKMLETVEKMFGCVHQGEQQTVGRAQNRPQSLNSQNLSVGPQDDVSHAPHGFASTTAGSVMHTNGSHTGNDVDEDREMFDTVVAEGMKYKRKCKMLKNALLDLETRCLNEKANVQLQVEEMRQQFERLLAESKAQHFIELTQCREERIQEWNIIVEENDELRKRCEELEKNCIDQENALDKTQKSLNEITQAHRETLRTHQCALDQVREELDTSYNKQIEKERQDHIELQKNLSKELQSLREEKAKLEEEHVTLMQRVNAIVCPDCQLLKGSLAEVQLVHDELSYERQRLLDECSYYHEENERLEKQVALIRGELEKQRSSPDFRNILKSEREQKLQMEAQQAKEQIIELQLSIESILHSKDLVENAVKTVIEENESLTASLNVAQSRVIQLESDLQQIKMAPPSPFTSPLVRERNVISGFSSSSKRVSFAENNQTF